MFFFLYQVTNWTHKFYILLVKLFSICFLSGMVSALEQTPVSLLQGSCGHNGAHHHQRVKMCTNE